MASYPIPSPVIDRPAAGQTYIDIIAPALTDVRAPEAGELMYVGDGTTAPFQGYSPGVILLYGQRSKLLHVFGFVDRAYIDALRTGGIWGWTGGVKHDSLLDPLVPGFLVDLADAIDTPPQYPRPTVAEGALIGRVAASRGRLRWTTMKFGANGSIVSPLEWADQNGLPPPTVVPSTPGPPVQPPVQAQSGSADGLVWLGLAYLVMEGL